MSKYPARQDGEWHRDPCGRRCGSGEARCERTELHRRLNAGEHHAPDEGGWLGGERAQHRRRVLHLPRAIVVDEDERSAACNLVAFAQCRPIRAMHITTPVDHGRIPALVQLQPILVFSAVRQR